MGCLLSYRCEPVSEWRSVLGSQKGALRTRRFHVCNEHAKHCLRIRARRLALALATAHHTRFDYAGVPDIDLEASSSQTWKQWTKRLSADERFSLTVWRAGAVRTETRLNHRQQNIHTECDWCDAPAATAILASLPVLVLSRSGNSCRPSSESRRCGGVNNQDA